MELAASRTKLMSPRALLARLDTALDIAAPGNAGPRRQKTLRGHDGLVLRTAVDGGATVVSTPSGSSQAAPTSKLSSAVLGDSTGIDALDVIATMLDASLVTVSDSVDGEPG